MLTARRLLLLAFMIVPAGLATAQTLLGQTNAPISAGPPQSEVPEKWPPSCTAEFTKLREEVKDKGLAAKAAGKSSREEMCRHITAYSAALSKWMQWAESNVQACGIAVQIMQRLTQVQSNAEQTMQKICMGLPSPWLDIPSPSLRLDVPSPMLPSPRLPTLRFHIAVGSPGRGQVVSFRADSAPSAALSPKSGG